MATSNLNLQIVFVSSLFHDVYFTSWLFWNTIRWRTALSANVWWLPVYVPNNAIALSAEESYVSLVAKCIALSNC